MPAILPTRSAESDSSIIRTQVTIFNTFAFIGVFSIAAVLVPALVSPHVHRSSSWFVLLASWMIYSISFLLLVGWQTGPEPPLGLCFFQAALIYASPILCAVGSCCYAIDYYLKTSAALFHNEKVNPRVQTLLLILPWIVSSAVFVETLLVVQDASVVERDPSHFYCHVTSLVPTLTNIVLVLLAVAILFALEIYTAIILRRNWRAFRTLSADNTGIALSVFVRLALFTILGGVAVSLSSVILHRIDQSIAIWSIAITTVPVIAALCFGTQKEIINAWMFWRKAAPDPNILSSHRRSSNKVSVLSI